MKFTDAMSCNIDLQKEIMEQIAKQMVISMDNQRNIYMLENMGWITIHMSSNETIDMRLWCDANLKGPYRTFGNSWCFQNQQDAAWFGLKWHDSTQR